MTRLEFNIKILAKLEEYLKNNPNQRFGQALINLTIVEIGQSSIIDPFYEESSETFERIEK